MPESYGIKISTPGNDPLTQAIKDLAFSSQYPSLKIIKSGDIEVTTDGSGNGTAYVTHGLSFAPAYFAFQKKTVQWTTLDASSYSNSFVPDPGTGNQWGGDNHQKLHVYTDSTKIYLQAKGAAASTTYYVHYILFIDIAESYTGNSISGIHDYGFKVSRQDSDVMTAKPYELGYSSRFKPLQYYDVNYKTTTLTLPIMFTSPYDTEQEEGTYVDIAHGLGYAPFFLAFFKRDIGDPISFQAPYVGVNNADNFCYGVSGFCDATRVRLSFWRKSFWSSGSSDPNWAAETITLKVYIFTEDLGGSFDAF
jgi:hypothetical protein